MSADSLPTLFVSHGAPTLPLEHVPAREFLATLGDRYRNAHAVLCISAHWNTPRPTVNAVEAPETIHDFYGFPAELYGLQYKARGSPDLAGRVADILHGAGLSCDIDDLSLIHISEPTRLGMISYAVFCL